MASEFQLRHNAAGATIYAIIRRVSDYYVWNGTTFEVWANGSIANYDIPLTDRGGDWYTADMPSGVAAGDYVFLYYIQAGGTPAITDDGVGTPQRRYWNGTVASSGSSVTLSAYALATLAQVKRDLDISDSTYDTHLTEFINQATDFIERTAHRKFVARNYRERLDGQQQAIVRTKQYPIVHLTRVAYGWARALSLTCTTGVRANATVYNEYGSNVSGGLRIVSVASTGTYTENNLTFADYDSVTELVAAVNLVSGWTAVAIQNMPSADLNPEFIGDVLNKTEYATYPDQVWNAHVIDYQAGRIQMQWQVWPNRQTIVESRTPVRFPVGFQGVMVEYRAGYESVPDALNKIARDLVNRHWQRTGVDLDVTQNTLGKASWTFDRSDTDLVMDALTEAGFIDVSMAVA